MYLILVWLFLVVAAFLAYDGEFKTDENFLKVFGKRYLYACISLSIIVLYFMWVFILPILGIKYFVLML